MEKLTINTIRSLSAEMVLKANSGHQGTPIGAAPMAFTLYNDIMKHNPKNSKWFDRDRFILSAGHASALQYSLLHIFGYDLSMEELKNFRQLDSQTPGHPEYGMTDGVELTTGPLGQGIAMATGFAMAEKHLAAKFNTEDIKIVDHYTYVIAGDGCMMEGVSNEAGSLAGTLGLDKLIVLYDSNKITIEGTTDLAFRENVKMRYEGLGWQVLDVKDGNDTEAIKRAIEEAKADTSRPSLIEIHTLIGYGTSKVNTAAVHGNPLDADDIAAMKKELSYEFADEFYVPDQVKEHIAEKQKTFDKYEDDWNKLLDEYKEKYPQKHDAFIKALNNDYDLSFLDSEEYYHFEKDLATRASSGEALNRIAKHVKNLFGGSADLAGSNNTRIEYDGAGDFSKEEPTGINLHFGVREHAMEAAANGISLHGGLRPYTGTFLSFADYMKPAIRLAALMHQPVINIFTHDSIGLGEDGPTHQAVDQLPMLRALPNSVTIRPADARETAAAWAYAIKEDSKPINLVLSRQKLPNIDGTGKKALKGAYLLKDFGENPQIILMASGSEVQLAYGVAEKLYDMGRSARVISMPSMELFDQQSDDYKKDLLPASITTRVSIEASSENAWYKYIGIDGLSVRMDTFGKSAPDKVVFEDFGFTVEDILAKVEERFEL